MISEEMKKRMLESQINFSTQARELLSSWKDKSIIQKLEAFSKDEKYTNWMPNFVQKAVDYFSSTNFASLNYLLALENRDKNQAELVTGQTMIPFCDVLLAYNSSAHHILLDDESSQNSFLLVQTDWQGLPLIHSPQFGEVNDFFLENMVRLCKYSLSFDDEEIQKLMNALSFSLLTQPTILPNVKVVLNSEEYKLEEKLYT